MADPYRQTESGLYIRPPLRADSEGDIARRPDAWTLVSSPYSIMTQAGIRMSPERAMALAAYYAAIRNISEDIGKIPLLTYERLDERSRRRADDHSAFQLLHTAPNADMTSIDFRQTVNAWAMGWGNGYAEIVFQRDGATVEEFIPIHPSRVPPSKIRRENGELIYSVAPDPTDVAFRDSQDMIEIPARRMLHIKNIGDGILGRSVAAVGAESFGVNLAAQTFASSFYGNGMHVGAVLRHPGQLGDKAKEHLKESLSEQYAGAMRAHKTLVLEEGMDFSSSTVPPNEAQFIETRQFGIEEIARWFRISPHKLQHLLRSTFNNIEQLSLEYVTDTLMPWAVRWEQELQKKVFGVGERFFAEFKFEALLRGEMAQQAEFLSARFNMGSITPNEIRALYNENPLDDENADRAFVQGAMVPISSISAEPQEETVSTVSEPEPEENGSLSLEALADKINQQSLDAALSPIQRSRAEWRELTGFTQNGTHDE